MRESRSTALAVDTIRPDCEPLLHAMEQEVIGKRPVLKRMLAALLAGGHVLLDDVPGVGKTTLAKALAAAVDLTCRRIQFSPDVLPSDVTGVNVYDPGRQQFVFHPGPIFSNILLADEINRASPRTQSALLEVMEEAQVTVDGVSRAVPLPFMVIATENPMEYHGTFPLPENQLDRFLFRLSLGYPDTDAELRILGQAVEEGSRRAVLSHAGLEEMQQRIRQIHVADGVRRYIVSLAQHTRSHSGIALGLSPRGTLALQRAARAWAFLHGRDFVIPDDVKQLFLDVATHRMVLVPTTSPNPVSAATLLQHILDTVGVPTGMR